MGSWRLNSQREVWDVYVGSKNGMSEKSYNGEPRQKECSATANRNSGRSQALIVTNPLETVEWW